DAYEFEHRFGELLPGEREVHAVNFCGIGHAAHMLVKPEDGRTIRSRVAADAFKHRAAIADHVREDVNARVLPLDKASVMPDFWSGRQHPAIIATGPNGHDCQFGNGLNSAVARPPRMRVLLHPVIIGTPVHDRLFDLRAW